MRDPSMTPQISTSTTSRFTENIFQLQKTKIDEIKRHQCDFEFNFNQEDLVQSKKIITFNPEDQSTLSQWEHSLILYKKINEEITPILTQCIWANDTNITKEIQNHIFCSSQDIDYELSNVNIESSFILSNDSEFWLILRASKDPDEYTSIIKISKENYRVFISLGTYVKTGVNTLIFKTFSRQQLVSGRTQSEESEVSVRVSDKGEEKIDIVATVNGGKENIITSDFFLPVIQTKNIMFCGNGKKTTIRSMFCEVGTKGKFIEGNRTAFSMERKNCNCCIIW